MNKLPRIYLKVDFDTDAILRKVKEVEDKAQKLKNAVYELNSMCGDLIAETTERRRKLLFF